MRCAFAATAAVLFSSWSSVQARNPLNEYLSDKVFGAIPGPCPTYNEKCEGDYKNLPEGIKDINVCIFNGACKRLGDLLKDGYIEVWDLQCRNIAVDSTTVTQLSAADQDIESTMDIKGIKLACSFMTNAYDVTLALDDSDGTAEDSEKFRVIATLKDTRINFPNSGTAGTLDTAIHISLSTDKSKNEKFEDSMPYQIELPADQCTVGVGLGINLRVEDFEKLLFCNKGNSGWSCTDLSGLGPLLKFFNVDQVISAVVRVLEAFVGGIVCQFFEELAILSGPPERDGVLNVVLKTVKDTVDHYADTPFLDPATFDDKNYILSHGVDEEDLENSADFSDNTAVELVSVALNSWLGAPSMTPGYKDKLVIDELVDQITEPNGDVLVDLVELDLAPRVELPINVTDLTIVLNKLTIKDLNTFSNFEILQNLYNGGNSLDRYKYTLTNEVKLDKFTFAIEVYVKLAPGHWVTQGVKEEEFLFSFAVTVDDVIIDAATLVLFEFHKLSGVQVGQITDLVDKISPDQPASVLNDALQCISPALHAFNFTNMEVSLGRINKPVILNDGESSPFLEDVVDLVGAVTEGALKAKLPDITRGIIRETINDYLAEYIIQPGKQGTERCPKWTADPAHDLLTIDFASGLLATAYKLIDGSIGGAPIKDSGTDINELIDVILKYYSNTMKGFPIVPVGSVQGDWKMNPVYSESLKLPAFDIPTDYIWLKEFRVEHLNSIYRLNASQVDPATGGIYIDFGIGGEMSPGDPTPGVQTPLTIRFPFEVYGSARQNTVPPFQSVTEQFELTLGLEEVGVTFGLSEVIMKLNFLKSLYLTQVEYVPCLLATLKELTLPKPLRSLGFNNLRVGLVRAAVSDDPSTLGNALTALDATLSQNPPPEFPRFENLVNTILENGVSYVLDMVEESPKMFENATSTSCVDMVLLNYSVPLTLPNISNCLAPVDFVNYPSVESFEAKVVYGENDDIVNLQEAGILQTISGLLEQTFRGGGLNAALLRLGNTTGAFIADIFVLDPSDPTLVDLVVPLSLLGLEYSSDVIIPGFQVQGGNFIVRRINKFLNELSLLNPVGAFTTRHSLNVKPNSLLNVTIESFVTMDRSALDGEGATGTVTEVIETTFTMSDFTFEMDLLTAFNPAILRNLTLGHFLTTDTAQTFHLAASAVDCWMSTYFENGFSVSKLLVKLGTIDNLSVRTRSNEILNDDMELVFVAVVELLTVFYKNALTNICQHCLRGYINDKIQELTAAAACPSLKQIPFPPLKGDNQILRFSTSENYAQFQNVWKALLIDDSYQNLNVVLSSVLGKSIFFDESKGDEFSYSGIPLAYYGESYGSVDVGIANVRLTDLSFSSLLLGEPRPQTSAYSTHTEIEIPSAMNLEVDITFNAYNLFPDTPVNKNKVRLGVELEKLLFSLDAMLKVNITKLMRLEVGSLLTIEKVLCLLIPIEKLEIDNTTFALTGAALEVTCIESCDFPALEALGSETFRSDDSEKFGKLVTTAVNYGIDIINNLGIESLLNKQVFALDEVCGDLGQYVSDLFNVGEKIEEDAASVLSYTVLGISSALALASLLAFPIHRRRREKTMNEAMDGMEESGMKDTDVALKVDRMMSSMFHSKLTPLWVKFVVPFLAFLNIAFVILATTVSGLMYVTVELTLGGSNLKVFNVIPTDMSLLVNTLWNRVTPILALLIVLTSILLPAVSNIVLLVLWFVPGTVVSTKNRASIVLLIERLNKLSVVLLPIQAGLVGALYNDIHASDSAQLAFLSPSAVGVTISVAIEQGLAFLMAAALFTFVMTYLFLFFERRSQNRMMDTSFLGSMALVVKRENTTVRSMWAYNGKVQVSAHHFLAKDQGQRRVRVSRRGAIIMICLIVLSGLLVITSVFLPVIKFETFGVGGILFREISDGSPTLEAGKVFGTNTYSWFQLGQLYATAPQHTADQSVRVWFGQAMFYLLTVVAPLAQIGMMLVVWLLPLNFRGVRRMYWMHGRVLSWNGFDLAVLNLLIASLTTPKLVSVFLNWASSVASPDLCDQLENVFLIFVSDENDATCMSVHATLQPAFAVHVLALLISLATTFAFTQVTDAVIGDRGYAIHGMKPVPTKIGRLILSCFLERTITDDESDHEVVESRICENLCGSCFKTESIEERIENWQQKFGGSDIKSVRAVDPADPHISRLSNVPPPPPLSGSFSPPPSRRRGSSGSSDVSV